MSSYLNFIQSPFFKNLIDNYLYLNPYIIQQIFGVRCVNLTKTCIWCSSIFSEIFKISNIFYYTGQEITRKILSKYLKELEN